MIKCLFFSLFMLLTGTSKAGLKQFEDGMVPMKDGTRIYYKLYGNKGDTIILLHGGPGQNMYGIGPDLLPMANLHVLIMYDQRGCGNSEAGPANSIVTADMHVDDLEDLRKHFGVTRLTLAGQSWGAMLATLYAAKYPRYIQRMLFISPGPPSRELFDARFASFRRTDSLGQSRVAELRKQLSTSEDPLAACREIHAINEILYFANDALIDERKGDYCAVPPEAIHKQARSGLSTLQSLGDWDFQDIGQNIRQPVLLLEGALSPVPVIELQTWKNIFPDARIFIFPRSGHGYAFIEEKDLFFEIIETFFRGQWPGKRKK